MPCYEVAALIIATMPVLSASGSRSQASMTAASPTFAPGLTLPLFLQERASFSVTMVEHE
jgi:hypothetical protein